MSTDHPRFQRLAKDIQKHCAKNYSFDTDVSIGEFINLDCTFENCTFKKELNLSGATIENLKFQNCTISHLKIESPSARNSKVIIEDKSNITTLSISKGFIVEVNNSTVGIIESNLAKFSFTKSKILDVINDLKLQASKCEIDSIINHPTGELKLIETNITGHLNLFGFQDSNIDRGTINELVFLKRVGINNLAIFDLHEIKKILLFHSDLAGVQLVRCNLQNCQFEVINSIVKDIYLDSVKWPRKEFVKILSNGLIEKATLRKEDQLEARDFYRHLKIASINQHDKVHQLKFYALEMAAYFESLSLKNDCLDKLNLYISKITNYYGLNWWRPIILYLISTSIFYFVFYMIDEGYMLIGFQSILHRYEFGRNLASLLSMFYLEDFGRIFNPTHSFENFTVIRFGNSIRILFDFLLRIIQGLLVYQTISAFRKFFR